MRLRVVFPQSLQVNDGLLAHTSPRSLPSTFFPTYPLIIISFDKINFTLFIKGWVDPRAGLDDMEK
jgi:hypothetical protein